MPVLAGWLTGEQVSQEIIEQTLQTMGAVLGQHGGQPARIVQPGMGLITFSDSALTMQHNDEPPVLDWVPDRRTFVYRRPLSGAHVLYYIEDWPAQGNLLFASEIKALLAVGVPRRLHIAALDALLRYDCIPAPWTAFKDISVLSSGSILRWQRAKTVVNHATDFHLDVPYTSHNVVEQLHTALEEALVGLLPPHEQLTALTSGDIPSSITTCLTARHTDALFTVASIGYKKSDWKAAEHIAAACNRPFLAVTGIDQPEFWVAALAGLEAPCVDTQLLLLHQLLHTTHAETGARIAMSGLGGHTLLGIPKASPHASSQIFSQEALQQIRQEEPWETLLHARKLMRRASQFGNESQKQYYLDLHVRLPDALVSTLYQLATQEGMVVRSPYLRTSVMNMLTRLPPTLSDGTNKQALLTQVASRYFPDLQQAQRHATFAMPTTSLLKVEASDLLKQTLSQKALQQTGVFDLEVVNTLLKQQEVSRELLLVFTTQLFCQLFGISVP